MRTRRWDWGLHPDAERFLWEQVSVFLQKNRYAAELAADIERITATRFFDWLDHMVIPEASVDPGRLVSFGFQKKRKYADEHEILSVEGSTLFPVLPGDDRSAELAIRVDSVTDFRRVHAISRAVEGEEQGSYRRLVVAEENDCRFVAVERRGSSGYTVTDSSDSEVYGRALGRFTMRKRNYERDTVGIWDLEHIICTLIEQGDPARIADAFFRAERNYWETRNSAARIQKQVQDGLGLGWGNQDHHTFRSSRANFVPIIRIFKSLGFELRERFYAGAEAGWGAQVLEHPGCGIVVFADVDLKPDEKDIDFADDGLSEQEELGTVGLWVALHGESILQAGMHHLAARFQFGSIRAALRQHGIGMMEPFSDFPFLKQAFTGGEVWRVVPERLVHLQERGSLSAQQVQAIAESGAIGSHLENIERNFGFKGFNQKSVSVIIQATDPRKQLKRGA